LGFFRYGDCRELPWYASVISGRREAAAFSRSPCYQQEENVTAATANCAATRFFAALILLSATQVARADVVTDWNQTAVRATEIAGAPVPVQMRMMAIVHAAIFDAVNSIERKYTPYEVEVSAAPGASPEAAGAAAAHGILERLFPPQKAMIDAALAASLKDSAEGPAKTEGLRVGREVAEKLFALRKDDGAAAQAPYEFGKGAGVYQATPPMNMKPILAHWGNVKSFLLTSAKQFPMAGPPAVDSAAFAKDFDEVKRLGSKNSTARTSEQTAIAIHWAGSEVPPINAVARAVSAAKKLNLIDNARFFALLNMAMADSLIAGFYNKYLHNYWRPVTAIPNAGLASNSAISPDPTWEPLIVTPPHPDYPSGHCLGTGAAVTVLQAINGGDKFSASFVYPPLGVLRRWESFSQIAKEVEDARVWGGIHFRTADEHGTKLGRQVAEFALKTHLQPKTN
jgi:hypothetical protein